MSVSPIVNGDIEVLLADGTTWLPLALVETTDNKGMLQPKALDSGLSALLESLPLGQKLQSQLWQNTGQGIGLDYNVAYGLYTRTPGIVLPAGAANPVQVTLANGSNSPIVAIEELGPDLYFAQVGSGAANTGRVMVSAGGTGTGGGAPANSLNLGLNEYIRDLCLFSDPTTKIRYLYASSTDVNGLNGRLHRCALGGGWISMAANLFALLPDGSGNRYGCNRMWRVFWKGRTGLSYPRLVTISSNNTISYTDVGADPFLAASWIQGVEIDTAKKLLDLGGAKRRVFMRAQDNVYDINEYGETPALMSFENEVSDDGAMQYLKEYLYVASGRTLNRIYVGDATLTVQEAAAQCFPGFGTIAENDVRGYITAMCVDQGYIVAAVHNPSAAVQKSFICWGSDQGVQRGSSNPLNWYGPEAFSDANYKCTRMKTSGLAGDLRIWVAAQSVSGATPVLHWFSLPIAGAPLPDLISGGAMRFATGAAGAAFWNNFVRLELIPTEWTGATAIVDQITLLTRGLSIVRSGWSGSPGDLVNDGLGTKITYEHVADPPPGAITWPTGADVTITPSQTLTPATTPALPSARGERIWRRLKWFSPNGSATPPKIGVLDACRIDSWITAPTAVAIPLTIQYGVGISNLSNTASDKDPDYITDELTKLTTGGRTTVKTRDGKRWTAKFEQVLETHVEYTVTGPYAGKVITTKLVVLFLGSAA